VGLRATSPRPSRAPTLKKLRGHARYAWLSALGAASDRWAWVYRVDARVSHELMRRRLRRRLAGDRARPASLRWSEAHHFSQHGEDGVIDEIFRRIGTTNRRLVEVGASDGRENCTRNLLDQGWTGVWVEADEELAAVAARVAGARVVAEPAYRDNLAALLDAAGVERAPDLVAIDVDGDDLGLFRSALEHVQPRAAVVEYNAAFGPESVWSARAERGWSWDGTFRHGASLGALDEAARAAGYALVHCDTTGVNAFFVASPLADLVGTAGTANDHWRGPMFTPHPFGHPRSRRALTAMAEPSIDELRLIRVTALDVVGPAPTPDGPIVVAMQIHNGSSLRLTSGRPHAFHISLRWMSGDDEGVRPDALRIALPVSVPPGSTRRFLLWLDPPETPAPHRLRGTFVCERVVWGEQLGTDGYRDVVVSTAQ
jgi:hypothetical protein